MMTFLIAFAIIILAIVGLSLGAIVGRNPIKGSCGGLACIPKVDCATCPNRAKRDEST